MTGQLTDDQLDALGRLVDSLDNGIAATNLPLPPNLHIDGMKGIMEDVRDKLRSFLAGQGFDPWAA